MEESYPERAFLVQDLIKEGSFTLIGGSSAAGKSTLIYQEVWSWLQNGQFFGQPCARVPQFYYIAFDRLKPTIFDQLAKMGIYFDGAVWLESYAMVDLSKNGLTLPKLGQGDVLIFDGLDFLVKGGQIKEFAAVSELCRQCVQIIESQGVSIIGVIGANKTRGKNGDEGNPFDRLSGSGVWQRISETNMVVEVFNPGDTTCTKRTLHVRPRLSAPFQKFYEFKENGWLVETVNPASLKTPLGFFSILPDFKHFKLHEAIQLGAENKISEKTVKRYIDYLVDEKAILIKISHGTYRKKSTTH